MGETKDVMMVVKMAEKSGVNLADVWVETTVGTMVLMKA